MYVLVTPFFLSCVVVELAVGFLACLLADPVGNVFLSLYVGCIVHVGLR